MNNGQVMRAVFKNIPNNWPVWVGMSTYDFQLINHSFFKKLIFYDILIFKIIWVWVMNLVIMRPQSVIWNVKLVTKNLARSTKHEISSKNCD